MLIRRAGLENRSRLPEPSPQSASTSTSSDDFPESAADHLASRLALLIRKTPSMALVIERWEALPDAVRAGIVAMIEASTGATQ
jgi:hypothetical protein